MSNVASWVENQSILIFVPFVPKLVTKLKYVGFETNNFLH